MHCHATDFLAFPYEGELLTGSAISSSSGAVFRTLSAGKPLIVSDEGRLRDLVGGLHGWKVAQGDVESLKDAIVDAVLTKVRDSSRYERMCYSVRELADRLSWDKVATRHARAYDKVCSLWGIYSSQSTGAFAGITGEPIDFMSHVALESSTGSEMDELSNLADDLKDDLPTPPSPEEIKEYLRDKMIDEIDSMGGESLE